MSIGSLGSADVSSLVARSQSQFEKARARALEQQRRSQELFADESAASTSSTSASAETREEVAERVARLTQRGSEFVQVLANEPSVGLYHVHEHVLRTLPKWNELQGELADQVGLLERHRLDVEYSIGVVEQIVELQSFASLLALSRRSVVLVDQVRAMPPHRAP